MNVDADVIAMFLHVVFVVVVFFGVIFIMSAQAVGTWQPIAIVMIAAVVGLASATPFVRERAFRTTGREPATHEGERRTPLKGGVR
jgi:hypothetical protein